MSGHTAGPWAAKKFDKYGSWKVVQAANLLGHDIAPNVLGSHGEDEANARLIAAAPDLLASTQMLLDVLAELDDECDVVSEFQAPIRHARDVIAKATGAQP